MSRFFTRKACEGCRKSKKRCNGVRPTCSTCESCNADCVYPTIPARAFVVYEGPRKQASGPRSADENLPLHPPYDRRFWCTGADAHLADAFWSTYLPSCNNDKSPVAKTFSAARYLAGLRIVTETHSLSRMARTACALTVLGHRNSDRTLGEYGMEVYGRCMRGISNLIALSNPSLLQLQAVTAACRLMSLYEMMRSPGFGTEGASQGKDWRAHARATCGLLQNLANRQSAPTQAEADMYRELEHMRIWVNFSARRADFFNRQSFRQQLSAGTEPGPNYFAHLQSLMQKVPRIFATCDALTIGPSSQAEETTIYTRATRLIKALVDLGRDFKEWERQIREAKKQKITDIAALADVALADVALADVALAPELDHMPEDWLSQSDEHEPGILLALNEQWACRAAVGFQAVRVAHKVQSVLGTTISFADGPLDDIWYCLRCITLSTPTLMSIKAGLWISEQSLFPISVAVHTLAGLGVPENNPCRNALMKFLKDAAPGEAAFSYPFFKSHANECCSETHRGNMDDPAEHQLMAFGFYG